MTQGDLDRLTQHIRHALRSDSHLGAASANGNVDALAAEIAQAWQDATAENAVEGAQQVGTELAAHNATPDTLVAIGRALMHHAMTQGVVESDDSWRCMAALARGYMTAVKAAVAAATLAEARENQQREDQLRAVIQELSTPIIPIHQGVLVLPLVGAIDSLRSQEITERLLEEIVRLQADIVIIDITGVSVVDTSVANHLIMTAQAVNLLGSRVVFTGISSTIAQTIVQLGVSLGDVVTLSNLQAGMQYALKQLGLEIVEVATHSV
jgi:anti-anti-sigma regulatory factor